MRLILMRRLIKCSLFAVLGFAFCVNVLAKQNLVFPSFPASFEEAEYKGLKGCIANDARLRFAIMKNEGLENVGRHSQLTTPTQGIHVSILFFNFARDYGYLMSNIGDGKICIGTKIFNLKVQNSADIVILDPSRPITSKDCSFEAQVLNMCGKYKQVKNRLKNGGYNIDWQATNEEGHILTMLSGTGQSWILTTHKDTGATIFTGAGKGEFVFPDDDKD